MFNIPKYFNINKIKILKHKLLFKTLVFMIRKWIPKDLIAMALSDYLILAKGSESGHTEWTLHYVNSFKQYIFLMIK